MREGTLATAPAGPAADEGPAGRDDIGPAAPAAPVPAEEYAGCYDLVAMSSVPGPADACTAATLVPARPETAAVVERFLSSGEVLVEDDPTGGRTLVVRGFEVPDLRVWLAPPPVPPVPAPMPGAVASRVRRRVRAPEPVPMPDPQVVVGRSAPPPEEPPDGDADTAASLPPGATVALPTPVTSGFGPPVEGSQGLERTLEDISRSASRMECGASGCRCPHPPCVPCGLVASRRAGMAEDAWAAHWVVWYATEASPSERILAARSLTTDESDVVRRAKYRWGFAAGIDTAIGRWNWEDGRVPAGLVGGGKAVARLEARGARIDEPGSPPAADVAGALQIVNDLSAPQGARIHAMRWLAARGARSRDVQRILKAAAAGDPDDSVRAVALDALESLPPSRVVRR